MNNNKNAFDVISSILILRVEPKMSRGSLFYILSKIKNRKGEFGTGEAFWGLCCEGLSSALWARGRATPWSLTLRTHRDTNSSALASHTKKF